MKNKKAWILFKLIFEVILLVGLTWVLYKVGALQFIWGWLKNVDWSKLI